MFYVCQDLLSIIIDTASNWTFTTDCHPFCDSLLLRMPSQHHIRSVLSNFLGTFTARYSDYHGYWLFGFVVPLGEDLKFDLLASPQSGDSAWEYAQRLAVARFRDQLSKASLKRSLVIEASLSIRQVSEFYAMAFEEHTRDGWDISFCVDATMQNGRHYEKQRTVFVAPHDPQWELRRHN